MIFASKLLRDFSINKHKLIIVYPFLLTNFVFSRAYSNSIPSSNNPIKRLVTVMDMDECMVHACSFGDDDYKGKDKSTSKKNYSIERSQEEEKASENTKKVESIRIMMEDNTPVHVRFRPGLKEFLKDISLVSDVYVFTAAMPVYARPVIKHIDPDGTIFKKSLFRQSCSQVRIKKLGSMIYVKDLKAFGDDIYDEKRTVLVDNNILSFYPQPDNGIHVTEFYDSAEDDELERVKELIFYLSVVPDVRVPLSKMFQIDENLKKFYEKS